MDEGREGVPLVISCGKLRQSQWAGEREREREREGPTLLIVYLLLAPHISCPQLSVETTHRHAATPLQSTEHRQDKLLPCLALYLNNTSGNVETNYIGPVRGSVPA